MFSDSCHCEESRAKSRDDEAISFITKRLLRQSLRSFLAMTLTLILIFFFTSNIQAQEEIDEEKPALKLPEVIITGEDQSRIIVTKDKRGIIDIPSLKKKFRFS